MDLSTTQEQRDLIEHVGALLGKECPPERVRAAEHLGFDKALWDHTVDFGLPLLALAESQGGGGGGVQDLALVAEEYGRWLAPVPLVETAVVNGLLARLADRAEGSAAQTLLDEARQGVLVTLGLLPLGGNVTPLVQWGAVADAIVVLDGDEVIVVRRHPEASHVPLPNLGSAALTQWAVEPGRRQVLAKGPVAAQAFEAAFDEWRLLQAAALVGLASRALEMGVDYVKQRHAFGVLIGWFQSIQHHLADCATAIDGARLLCYEAAWAVDEGLPNAAALASMAFLFASQTAFETASWSLHFHGGYGYTLEYDIQLYFRRAKAWALVAGDPHRELRRLATLLFEED